MARMTVKRLLGLVIVLTLGIGTDGESCERLSACSCECGDGIIDLEPLASKNGPKYKDQAAPDSYMYSYNPCFAFTETNQATAYDFCHDVAACQVINQGGVFQYYDIGTQQSATFETRRALDVGVQQDGDVVVAKYVAEDGGRQSEVVLVCNNDNDETQIGVVGELPQSGTPTYRFIIVSPDACFVPAGMSAGSIMLIVFFSGIAAYLLVGMLYKKFVLKGTGQEIIPNNELWFSLPGLIKDGFSFVLRRKVYSPV